LRSQLQSSGIKSIKERRLLERSLESCIFITLKNITEITFLTAFLNLCANDKMPKSGADTDNLPLEDHLSNIEKDAIVRALEKTRYNKTAAAKLLGMSFRALRYRLKKLGLD